MAFVSTSTTISKPTGVAAGDLLTVFVNVQNAAASLAVTGFTSRAVATSGSEQRGALFDRVADGSEGSTFTITTTAGTQLSAVALRISGVDAAPFDANATDDSGGGYVLERSFDTVTTTVDGDIVLGFLGGRQALDTTTVSGWTLTLNAGPQNYVYSKTQTTAGATGVTNFNQPTTFDAWCSITAAYKPSAPADPPLPPPLPRTNHRALLIR
jgi:hypothetical protein